MIDLLTADELRSNMQASVQSDAPQMSTSIDTDEGVIIELLVDALVGLERQVQGVEDDAIVSENTSTEALDMHADAHFEGGRIAAQQTEAVAAALTVSGAPGSIVPAYPAAGSTLVHADGTRYMVVNQVTIPASGTIEVDLQSISTGAACNKVHTEHLTFETAPTGVDSDAILLEDLTGATDQESDTHLLERLIDVIRHPHAGGRASDYRQWAMEVPRVDRAFVYCPNSAALDGRRGKGTVDVAILTSGTCAQRIPSAGLLVAVTIKMDMERPAGAADHRELAPAPVVQTFDIKVGPEAGYEFDWETASSFTVDTWTPSTLTLKWSASVPAGVSPGSRILVRGQMVKVVSISGDQTVVDADLIVSGGENIYPAGPLTQVVIDAVATYMDGLGPARGVAADREQAGWDDTIRISKLFKTILTLPGVLDAEIMNPSSNVTPTDHAPSGTVDLLVYGLIEVRPL